MVELDGDRLVFCFPEVHEAATLAISVERTLRIPSDGRNYPLPPSMGRFPLRRSDDQAPPSVRGVKLPLYRSEAMAIRADAGWVLAHHVCYPFAVRVGLGTTDALTGSSFEPRMVRRPQNYAVVPEQTWVDGLRTPHGSEQLVGDRFGGDEAVHLSVHPMKASAFERRFPRSRLLEAADHAFRKRFGRPTPPAMPSVRGSTGPVGRAGRTTTRLYDDPYPFEDWDLEAGESCSIQPVDARGWPAMAGEAPPPSPTAQQYLHAGLPWLTSYDPALAR